VQQAGDETADPEGIGCVAVAVAVNVSGREATRIHVHASALLEDEHRIYHIDIAIAVDVSARGRRR
jgi:hypothetical protein